MITDPLDLSFAGEAASINARGYRRAKIRVIPIDNPTTAVVHIRKKFHDGPINAFAVAKVLDLDGSSYLDLDISDTPGISIWVVTPQTGKSIRVEAEFSEPANDSVFSIQIDLSTKGPAGVRLPIAPNRVAATVAVKLDTATGSEELDIHEAIVEGGDGVSIATDIDLDGSLNTTAIGASAELILDCVVANSDQTGTAWIYTIDDHPTS